MTEPLKILIIVPQLKNENHRGHHRVNFKVFEAFINDVETDYKQLFTISLKNGYYYSESSVYAFFLTIPAVNLIIIPPAEK